MKVGCDIGGTFTDLIAFDEHTGQFRVGKALNSGQGPAAGVRGALEAAGLTPDDISVLMHGTTVVTNLLIERTGDAVGLICTQGFRDVLEIQSSFRALTFDARYRKVAALVPRRHRLEIAGRIDRQGIEIEPLDKDQVIAQLTKLYDAGIRTIAVSLYNAYANPTHERQVAAMWRSLHPECSVSCSTDVDPRLGEYERVSTATLNASAVPAMRAYVDEMTEAIVAPTRYMHSAGGVLPAEEVADRPILLAFSGPAAGVLAGQRVLKDLGLRNGITLDMGGTSCDVCLIADGRVRERETFNVAWDVPARVRSLDIGTIGAGGGSIAWCDAGGALQVGPRSAGALPGPACYGRGGSEPTVTDANLVLGILPQDGLLAGSLPLDIDAATTALATLAPSFGVDPPRLAAAIHRTISASMASAVREITVRHGIDPRDSAMIAFGGAGPQHACAVARELGISTVIVPADSSVLSASGLLSADVRGSSVKTVRMGVEGLDSEATAEQFAALEAEAAKLLGEPEGLIYERFAGLRYQSQWHQVALEVSAGADASAQAFRDEHARRYGTRLDVPIEVVELWATAVLPSAALTPVRVVVDGDDDDHDHDHPTRFFHLSEREVPVHMRERLADGVEFDGPALIQEPTTVTVLDDASHVRVQAGHLVITLGDR